MMDRLYIFEQNVLALLLVDIEPEIIGYEILICFKLKKTVILLMFVTAISNLS